MLGTHNGCKNLALTIITAGALMGFAPALSAHGHQKAENSVSSAQQQLKNDGYYKGTVDGIDGPATQSAIRQYQQDKNLKVNGKLDRATRDRLGVRDSDDANRSANENNRNHNENNEADRSANPPERSTASAPSSAAVSAAQRGLRDKGFYSGDVNGRMNTETRSAIRSYQKNSNLNVTGNLDQATLHSLGVSK